MTDLFKFFIYVPGYCIGFMLTITSYAFMMCLVVFFLTSSWATKYQSQRKRDLEEDFKEGSERSLPHFVWTVFHFSNYVVNLGGQRNWVQVLCNGGIAAYLAVIVFIENGCGERVIDLEFHYRQSWLSLAILCKTLLNSSFLTFLNSLINNCIIYVYFFLLLFHCYCIATI